MPCSLFNSSQQSTAHVIPAIIGKGGEKNRTRPSHWRGLCTCSGDCSADSAKRFVMPNGKLRTCKWAARKEEYIDEM